MLFESLVILSPHFIVLSGLEKGEITMYCECGELLMVVAIEEIPQYLSKEEKLLYDRVCDVQCQDCGKIYYSQPYDFGKRINLVKGTKKI